MLNVTITSSLPVGGDADVSDGVFQTDRPGSLLCCNTQRAGFWHVSYVLEKKSFKDFGFPLGSDANYLPPSSVLNLEEATPRIPMIPIDPTPEPSPAPVAAGGSDCGVADCTLEELELFCEQFD